MSKALALALAIQSITWGLDLEPPQERQDEHDDQDQPEDAGRSPAPLVPAPRGCKPDAAEQDDD